MQPLQFNNMKGLLLEIFYFNDTNNIEIKLVFYFFSHNVSNF